MRSLSTVHSPVGVIPQLVYVPAASGTPHMYVFNEGNSTAYIGGPGVNTVNGLALVPNQNVQVNIAYGTVYAVGGFYANGTATTSLNAATTIGGTAFTVGAGAGFTAGFQFVVEVGKNNQECFTVSTSNAGTITTLNAALYPHTNGGTVVSITSSPTAVHSESGTF